MDRRLAADPLDVSRPRWRPQAMAADRKSAVSSVPTSGLNAFDFGDAKCAAQVAAGQVEQMRRDQFDFLAELDAMAEDSRLATGLARTAFAGGAIDATPMLAQRARAHVPLGTSQPLSIDRIHNHRAPE